MSGPVIVGGGPAGSAAAILLAQAGRAVTLIERTAAAHHKVCGDFLSAEAIRAITALGVDLSRLQPSNIHTLRLVHGERIATTALPFPALGVTRRALDEALLRQAEACGATILRGRGVRGIDQSDGNLRLDDGTRGPIATDTIFLATGKHDLRGAMRPLRNSGPVGLKMYFVLDPAQHAALTNHIELVLFAGGYAGLQVVEAGQAVLCMLLPRSKVQAVSGRWADTLAALLRECPHLARRLAGARQMLDRPLAISGLPYGHLHAPDRCASPGLFRLGDQASVIASLTGDGVAQALASATLAARTWLDHGNASGLYHRRLTSALSRQMRVASLLHRICLAPAAQPWVLRASQIWPGAMRLAAALTRVPGNA